MADFKKAIEWMRDGKRVRRSGLAFDTDYLIMGKEYVRHCRSEEEGYDWKMDDFEAKDWEIYPEKTENLSDKIFDVQFPGNQDAMYGPVCRIKHIQEAVKIMKNRIKGSLIMGDAEKVRKIIDEEFGRDLI